MKNLILTAAILVSPLSAQDTPHPAPAADAALPQGSLYVLKSNWTDQNSKTTEWSKSVGTPRVVALTEALMGMLMLGAWIAIFVALARGTRTEGHGSRAG